MTRYCLPFATDRCNADAVELVGGKNASLGELIEADVRVPPGFAVTTEFYETFIDETGLRADIDEHLAETASNDRQAVPEVGEAIRNSIESRQFPTELEQAIEAEWEALVDRCEDDDIRVAVRSSATAEDLPDASFAGQQETYLGVGTLPTIKERVRDCIASLFTDRALAYRDEHGFDHDEVRIGVGVQKMVDARSSGVMFSLNPSNGDRSKVRIEANWGLGEAVVAGEVTPDSFLVDKPVREIVEENVSTKDVMTAMTADEIDTVEVPPEKRERRCLSRDEIRELTTYAKRIEDHYGQPQDIEWAIEDTDGESTIYILQSRPETTWQEQTEERDEVEQAPSTSEDVDPVSQILDTLGGGT